MRRHLPAAMLGVPRTRPPATLGAWFRGSLAAAADALARSPALLGHGRFDEAALARLAAEHRAGRRDHGRLLWQLLMLEKSLARLFGDNSRPASR
jgi:asparagine synthase (glutamine-hydrolysing)